MMRSKAELQSKFKSYISTPMSKAELQSKLRHYILSKPKRALHKARNFYVKSVEECTSKVGYGGVIGGACPAAAPQVSRLAPSPGRSSFGEKNEEKFVNFLEEMSKKRTNDESNLQEEEDEIRYDLKEEYGGGLKRCYSSSVGALAIIDEEKPCCFDEDALFSRSRSHAYKRYYYH